MRLEHPDHLRRRLTIGNAETAVQIALHIHRQFQIELVTDAVQNNLELAAVNTDKTIGYALL